MTQKSIALRRALVRGIGVCGLSAGLVALAATPAQAATKTLNLFNWSDYIAPKIITQFEHKYHVKVVQNFYESNPELFAKLQAGGDSQYDVVVPSGYFVKRLIGAHLIQKLNHKLIPNLDNLLPTFRNPSFDPGDTYSVPYQWGTTGLVYNTKDFKKPPASWGLLFNPKLNSQYPFALGKDGQFMLGVACAYQGNGYTCVGKKSWVNAAKLLIKTKKRSNFSGFVNGTPTLQQLVRGVIDVGISFNGDFLTASKKNPGAFKHLKYVLPKEGTQMWVDTMAIPAKAPHPKLANEFINFVLSAKAGAELSNHNMYASPNKAARPYLKPALQSDVVNPTPAEMKRLHFTPALHGKELKLMNQIWTEVRSR